MQFNVRMFLHSLGNTSRHFRAVERPLSGRGSVDQSEATEHWRFPGLFRVMRFISSRNTNGPENQVASVLTLTICCCRCFRARNIRRNINCHSVPRSDQSRIMSQSPRKRASVHYCLSTKISIRAKRLISRVFSLFIVPSPFFVHCPYKGRSSQAESVLTWAETVRKPVGKKFIA